MKRKTSLLLASVLSIFTLATPLQAVADGKTGGSMTCTILNNQIWDLEGSYTDVNLQPVVSLWQGGSYIQHFNTNTATSNVSVSTQVSAQTTNLDYTLRNGTSSSDPVLMTTTCSAKVTPPAPAPQPTPTPSVTSTPTTTASTPTTTNSTPSSTTTKTEPRTVKPSTSTLNNNKPAEPSSRPTSLLVVGFLLLLLGLIGAWVIFLKRWPLKRPSKAGSKSRRRRS